MHPLDTLIWTALTTRQAPLSEGGKLARRMREDVGPFAAAADQSEAAVAALASIIPDGGDISLLEPSPPAPPTGAELAFSAPGIQMAIEAFVKPAARDLPIEPLGDGDAEEMLALA